MLGRVAFLSNGSDVIEIILTTNESSCIMCIHIIQAYCF